MGVLTGGWVSGDNNNNNNNNKTLASGWSKEERRESPAALPRSKAAPRRDAGSKNRTAIN